GTGQSASVSVVAFICDCFDFCIIPRSALQFAVTQCDLVRMCDSCDRVPVFKFRPSKVGLLTTWQRCCAILTTFFLVPRGIEVSFLLLFDRTEVVFRASSPRFRRSGH